MFEPDMYLIKICIGVFVCLSQTIKEKNINGLTNAINNLALYIENPGKIIKEADKVKINASKLEDLKNSFRGRSSASF